MSTQVIVLDVDKGKQVPSIRSGTTLRKPWVKSANSPDILNQQAAHYLLIFDYRKAAKFSLAVEILAKVVCNLRNYYSQSADQTVRLIQQLFNPKSHVMWSPEGIRLVWELVEPYTPSLGLVDEKAIAKQKAMLVRQEVAYLLEWTVPDGRTLDADLLAVFREWNPEIEITSNLFSRAVKAVTGLSKFYSNSKGYWVGFHLPTVTELENRLARVA